MIKQNNSTFVKVKAGLSELMEELKSCEISEKQEPETRVKTIIHTTLAGKLSTELRKTQAIQGKCKTKVRTDIKRQIRIVCNQELSEERLDELARDPDAA